jgi:predicted HAD superfamily phosphohydrolase
VPLNTRLSGILDWLREGYPAGVPAKDYIPLLALLRRTLTEDEVRQVAEQVASLGNGSPEEDPADIGTAEIGVRITKLIDAMPTPEDIARVEARLATHHGWDVGRPEDEPA